MDFFISCKLFLLKFSIFCIFSFRRGFSGGAGRLRYDYLTCLSGGFFTAFDYGKIYCCLYEVGDKIFPRLCE